MWLWLLFVEKTIKWYIPVAGSAGGVVFLIILVLAIYFIRRKLKGGKESLLFSVIQYYILKTS